VKTYGIHGIHGRAVAIATSVELVNSWLKVIVGSDGEGYDIGLNHMIHAARQKVGLSYIVSINEIYGLFTG
jgi:2-oxoglutarate ferredoxin oxidoreductase subunit beta